ncbi:MAG: transposase [Thermomicrobiales bacterium]
MRDPAADANRCPEKETLRFLSQCERTHRRVYEASAVACATCTLRAHCTTSQRGRRIGRSLDEEYLERVRGCRETAAYATAMRKRKVRVEPRFADAKEWHGLRRFRVRGLEKVNIQAQVIATGRNMKRFLSKQGWGRRPWPCGAVGTVLPAAEAVAVSLR